MPTDDVMLAVQHPTWNSSQRTAVLIGGVVLLHALALWALHVGLFQRTVEVVVPVTVISHSELPLPIPPLAKPPEPPRPPESPKPVSLTPPTLLPASPEPPAVLSAPTTATTGPAVPLAAPAPPPTPLPTPPIPLASGKPKEETVEGGTLFPEFSTKDYLDQLNRRFERSMSGRMGEHGRVMLQIIVDKSGQVKSASVLNPSPYPMLDKFALNVVAIWKFNPLMRNGTPEEMTITVPFVFGQQKN
jgi:protein TonB